MCMIIFLISKVTKSAFLARVWEWRGIGTDCPVIVRDVINQECESINKIRMNKVAEVSNSS